MSFGCHSWEFWLQMMAVVAVAPRKAGRQLPPWRELEVVQVENLSLRHRALQWLTSTGRQCHPLTSSSDRGRNTYLGRCSYHSHCPKRFRFALLDATRYHQQRNLGTQSHHQFDDGQALRRYGAGLTACLLTEKNQWLLRGRCRSVERPMVSQGYTLEDNHEEDREQPEG